jgi:hypothetical protein
MMPAAGDQADHDGAGHRKADGSSGNPSPASAAPCLGEQRREISRAG